MQFVHDVSHASADRLRFIEDVSHEGGKSAAKAAIFAGCLARGAHGCAAASPNGPAAQMGVVRIRRALIPRASAVFPDGRDGIMPARQPPLPSPLLPLRMLRSCRLLPSVAGRALSAAPFTAVAVAVAGAWLLLLLLVATPRLGLAAV